MKTAQRLGITFDEIRGILALCERGERPCGNVRGVPRREVAAVDNRLVELRQLREPFIALDRLADSLSEGDDGIHLPADRSRAHQGGGGGERRRDPTEEFGQRGWVRRQPGQATDIEPGTESRSANRRRP